jgi:isoquinoline 1-oxidoreductase beta subunit
MSHSPTKVGLSRRQFVQAGGALLFAAECPMTFASKANAVAEGAMMNSFVRIDPSNVITMLANHSEFGNGAYTVMTMMLAEELDVDYRAIQIEAAPTSPDYYSPLFREYLTAGSVTTGSTWLPMRTAGAKARAMLVEAASQEWAVPPAELSTEAGVVSHSATGRRTTYGQLLESIHRLKIMPPDTVSLKDPSNFKVLGKPTKRYEGAAKVDGTAQFGIDLKLPGMLHGAIARPPVHGGRVVSFDATAALKMPGVVKVKAIGAGVVVLARSYWQAHKARGELNITWDRGDNDGVSSEQFYRDYRALAEQPGMLAEDIGDALGALSDADRVIESVYEMPLLAHATLEPMNCIAQVSGDACTIWSGTQYQSNDQEVISRFLGIPQENVTVHRPLMGGSFGRRSSKKADFTVEAVEAAMGESVPVKIIWSREEDIRSGHYRPLFVHKMRGSLDASGMPEAWHQVAVGQSLMQGSKHDPAYMVRGIDIYSLDGCLQAPFGVFPYGTSYQIPHHRVESHNAPRIGIVPQEWRSVGHTHTGIAYECFLDELADAGEIDPLELRLRLSKDHARMNRVLRVLREKSQWDEPLAAGRGRGMAARIYSVSPVAQAVEVSVADNGDFTIDRVVCVLDCGFAVNPLGIEGQVEGGIAFGLGGAAFGNIDIVNGEVQQSNFHDYPVIRMSQMPQVEVHILPSDEPPTGVGEQATAPIAPAVANALFNATGRRVRRFPLSSQGFNLV